MKTYLDCIPCFFKQALEAGRLAGADEATQKKITDELAGVISGWDLSLPPPEMGRAIYRIAKKIAAHKDPYKEIKHKSNQLALGLLPCLREKLDSSKDRLLMAAELAIAGNVIDYGVKNSLEIEQEAENFLNGNFDIHNQYHKPVFAYQEFKQALIKAKRVLYLADNAGETVFDLILIEEMARLPGEREVVYAVKDQPIINDALMEDALSAGIDKVARVISSGCDAPGTILKFCSESFLKIYEKADMIISKGQGNFEALSGQVRPIFFLFRVKCPVVARDIGCGVGDMILKLSP
ncbi:DUF89 domain-containing protein [Candidatus Omnitrophota bacterium]